MSNATIYCSRCGAANAAGANFCYQCGALLAAQRPPAAHQPPAPAGDTGAVGAAGTAESGPAPVVEPSESPPPVAAWSPPVTGPEPARGSAASPPFAAESAWPAPPPSAASAPPQGTPPSAPAGWRGGPAGPVPATPAATSSGRYVVLAGIVLLVLSCLWVMVSIGTHLSAGFGIFCLAPLGALALVVGLFLLLSHGTSRQP